MAKKKTESVDNSGDDSPIDPIVDDTPATQPDDPPLVTKMLNEFRNFVAGAAEEARKNFDPNPRKPKRFRLSPSGFAIHQAWAKQVAAYHVGTGAVEDGSAIGKNLAGIPVTEDNSLVGDAVLID